ncbi:MAG: DUF4350 domain-containing protein, partial [Polyangiaceae bacterium]
SVLASRRAKNPRLALALLVLAAACLIAPRAFAAAFDLLGTDWEGCADFLRAAREELGDGRIVATDKLDYAALTPQDSVILLHPQKQLDVASLTGFMHAGGRVILLDDYGTGDALLEHFDLERVPVPEHPAQMLRHNPALAIAVPAGVHAVVADVDRVVTNHPTGLKHPNLSPVLKIQSADGTPDVLIAVAGQVTNGRLLVVGDPSIVINSMLRYPGNKTFAKALVRYAGDDDTWGKRGGHVFILSGAFDQSGAYGDESNVSSLHEKLRALGDAVNDLQRNGLPSAASFSIAGLVGVGIILWVWRNAARTHQPTPPRFTRAIPLAAQGGVAGHAAVLAAPKTTRALAMLELKSALEEELGLLVGVDKNAGHDALAARLAGAGLLDSSRISELKSLLLRMANIETMVLSRQAASLGKIADSEVVVTAKRIRDLLEAARRAAHEKGAS